MPYKFKQSRRHHFKKPQSSQVDWARYNKALKMRGDITLWLSEDVISQWYESQRIYDGTGTPNLYTDMAILTVHEIRQVFKLPLRQCEGFVNSLFKMLGVELRCPSFSALSKRLKKLNINLDGKILGFTIKKTNQPLVFPLRYGEVTKHLKDLFV